MTDSLLSRFADLIVYLVPGLLLSLSAIYQFSPERLRRPEEKLGLGEMTIVLAGAYLVGVITFRISDKVIFLLDLYYRENALMGILRRFPELAQVTSSRQQTLGIKADDPVVCYRYAAAVVLEKSPRSADAAERLMALGHLFRNLLVCLPVTVLIWIRSLWQRFRWRGIATAFVCASVLEYVFLKSFLEFWAAGVWKYLRAYVVWSSLG